MSEEHSEERKGETPQPKPLTLKWRRTRVDRPDDEGVWRRTSYIATEGDAAFELKSDGRGWEVILRTKAEAWPLDYRTRAPLSFDDHEYPIRLVACSIKVAHDEQALLEQAQVVAQSLLRKHRTRSRWSIQQRERDLERERNTSNQLARLECLLGLKATE